MSGYDILGGSGDVVSWDAGEEIYLVDKDDVAILGAAGVTITDTPSQFKTTPIREVPALPGLSSALVERARALESAERVLTADEQKIVDAYQVAKAELMRVEEEKPYIDPVTGKVKRASATYRTGSRPSSQIVTKEPAWPLWLTIGVSAIGLGATVYLLMKAKWGWALANFFIITPAAVQMTALASSSIAGPGEIYDPDTKQWRTAAKIYDPDTKQWRVG